MESNPHHEDRVIHPRMHQTILLQGGRRMSSITSFMLAINVKTASTGAKVQCQTRPRRRWMATLQTGNDTIAKIVTATWLNNRLQTHGGDDMTILDVRGKVVKTGGRVVKGFQPVDYIADDNDYFSGHVPGARFVDWRKIDLSQHFRFCDDMAQLGIERERTVLVYDWGDMLFATRLWFALVAMGCHDVRVINGGWDAWDHTNGPVSLDTACPLMSYSEFESELNEDDNPRETVPLSQMRDITSQANNNILILDARSKKQFSGIERRGQRAGHIKGAFNIPYRTLLHADSIGILDDDDLTSVLQRHGALDSLLNNGDAECIAYCNGGVASSLLLFCLARCGVSWSNVRNYCGSFNEWGNLIDTAIE